jgi:hypothetical protein
MSFNFKNVVNTIHVLFSQIKTDLDSNLHANVQNGKLYIYLYLFCDKLPPESDARKLLTVPKKIQTQRGHQ